MKGVAREPRQIGNIIREARKRLGMSQQELAAATGIHQPTLSNLESGISRARIDTLLAVLSALNLEFRIAPRSEWDKDVEQYL